MDLVNVTRELLPDGRIYTGTLLITERARLPHGYGKMEYADYYVIGKYDKGILNSPAYVNHNYYMYCTQMRNNRGNGWGLMINRGTLAFGVYKNSEMTTDLTDFVEWFYDKMLSTKRQDSEAMSHCFPKAKEILIGFKGKTISPYVKLCFMGFHFMDDGSVFLGTTQSLIEQEESAYLMKFCPDGHIQIGLFSHAKLLEAYNIQSLIDMYWGNNNCHKDNIDDIDNMNLDDMFNLPNPFHKERCRYKNIVIDTNKNYFKM